MIARSNKVAGCVVVIAVFAVVLTATAAGPGSGDIWTKYYGGDQDTLASSVLLADDGGCFIVGITNTSFEDNAGGDIYLLRTDADGEVLWEKTYGGDGYEQGTGLTLMGDGSLLVSGVTQSADGGGLDVILISVDQDGSELWSRTYGGPLDEMVGSGVRTDDGGYMFGGNIVDPDDPIADPGAAGYAGLAGRSNLFVMKIDGKGNELWTRAYDSDDNVMAVSGAETADGGLLALATIMYYPEPGDDMLLMKLDPAGDVIWSRTWQDDVVSPQHIIQTSDGNYLITAAYSRADNPKDDYMFIKVDPDGSELWRSTFGDPDLIDYGRTLLETADGGFVTAGEHLPDLYTWDVEIGFVKIDKNGQHVWTQTRRTAHTMFTTVYEHPRDGYVIVGTTYREPVFNIFMTKTDAEGNME